MNSPRPGMTSEVPTRDAAAIAPTVAPPRCLRRDFAAVTSRFGAASEVTLARSSKWRVDVTSL